MIENNQITNFIQSLDIVAVIGNYLPLKKAGKDNYKALCPFHHEKTPSFMVSSRKQIFHCFGCGVGGNAISFIMKYENIDFINAVKLLADKYGYKLDFKSKSTDYSSYYSVMKEINEYNHKNIFKFSEPYEYLIKRNFTQETIKKFNIGYGADNNAFFNFVQKKKIDEKILYALGLIYYTANNTIHYRFNNRIIFPIFDITNKIIAFGGRIWQDDNSKELSKYINSPDNPIYKKGNNLYNLNLAKDYILEEDYCILVEGYVDAIMLYQAGIKNVVASLGTALTENQVKLISRYTRNIYVIYDADLAGKNAIEKSIELLLKEGIIPKTIELEEGLDPADFIIKYNAEEFKNRIKKSIYCLDYKIERLLEKYDVNDLNHKKIILENFFPLLNLTDLITRNTYNKKLADLLGVDEKVIVAEFNKFLEATKKSIKYKEEKRETEKQKIAIDDLLFELLAIMCIEPKSIKFIEQSKNEIEIPEEIKNFFEFAFKNKYLNINEFINEDEEIINKITEKMLEIENKLFNDESEKENKKLLAQYLNDVLNKLRNKFSQKNIKLLTNQLNKNQFNKELFQQIILLQKKIKNKSYIMEVD
ncbi:MAG TPA: DNA primase [bacterium]|nr:DNA primase [bacterium]HOL46927.1 DNA primase [bacterium]HPQ18311.1 DNA primase [bacterium]